MNDTPLNWCGLTFVPTAGGLLLPEGQGAEARPATLSAEKVLALMDSIGPDYGKAPAGPPTHTLLGFPVVTADVPGGDIVFGALGTPPARVPLVRYEDLPRLTEPSVN